MTITNSNESFVKKYFPVIIDNPDAVKLGGLLFLYLSFLRGFIYVGVSYLLNIVGEEVVALLGIIPILFLIIPDKSEMFWQYRIELSYIFWIISILIPILEFRIITILIGSGFLYGSLRRELLRSDQPKNVYQSVIVLIFLDIIIRAPSRGTDPIINYNIIQMIVIALVTVILILIRSNLTYERRQSPPSDVSQIVLGIAIYAFFGQLFLYFIYFANSGVITAKYNISNLTANSFWILGASVTLFAYIYLRTLLYQFRTPLMILFAIISITAVYFYPWVNYFFLYPAGFVATFAIMSSIVINVASLEPDDTRLFSIMLVIVIITTFAGGLLLLTADNQIIHLIIIGAIELSSIFVVIFGVKEEIQ